MKSPSFAFAIPCLNGAATLKWTIDSLLSQTAGAPATVVVDSGSTDGSLELCRAAGFSVRMFPKGNIYAAVDEGLHDLQADYFGYINTDDLLYRDALARFATAAADTRADVIYGGCDYIDSCGRLLYPHRPAPPRRLPPLLAGGILPFAQPSAVFRRELFLQLGGFGSTYRHIGDLSFYYRASCAGASFHCLDFPPVTAYRLHAGQLERREGGLVQQEKTQFLAAARSQPARYWRARLAWHASNWRSYAARSLLAQVHPPTDLDQRGIRQHTRASAKSPNRSGT